MNLSQSRQIAMETLDASWITLPETSAICQELIRLNETLEKEIN